MKHLVLFLELGLLHSACQKQEATFEQVVPSSSGAFWKIQEPSTEKKAYRGFKFYQNGRCVFYLLNKQGALHLYNGGDDEVTNTWAVRQDTLTINGLNIKILKVKKDTVYLYLPGDTLLLLKTTSLPH